MQSVSSRIWTRVAVSNSYDDNDYTMMMRPDKVETTVMLFRMPCAVLSEFSGHSHAIYNIQFHYLKKCKSDFFLNSVL